MQRIPTKLSYLLRPREEESPCFSFPMFILLGGLGGLSYPMEEGISLRRMAHYSSGK